MPLSITHVVNHWTKPITKKIINLIKKTSVDKLIVITPNNMYIVVLYYCLIYK